MIMYFHGDLIDELNDKNIEFFKAKVYEITAINKLKMLRQNASWNLELIDQFIIK